MRASSKTAFAERTLTSSKPTLAGRTFAPQMQPSKMTMFYGNMITLSVALYGTKYWYPTHSYNYAFSLPVSQQYVVPRAKLKTDNLAEAIRVAYEQGTYVQPLVIGPITEYHILVMGQERKVFVHETDDGDYETATWIGRLQLHSLTVTEEDIFVWDDVDEDISDESMWANRSSVSSVIGISIRVNDKRVVSIKSEPRLTVESLDNKWIQVIP